MKKFGVVIFSVHDKKLGNLEFISALEGADLLAEPVRNPLAEEDEVAVASIDPELSDTAAFCEQYEIGLDQAANCIVLEAKRADRVWYAACVVLANTRADVNGLVRKTLGARKVSFAPMEFAVEATGMEYGAITPVGLPADWSILVDERVANSTGVIVGSGVRNSKLLLPGQFLASLPNAQVITDLAREVQ